MSQNLRPLDPSQEPMSVGDWIITMIVLAIPIVGIVMIIIWGFTSPQDTVKSVTRANFCKAYIVIVIIGIVLSFLVGGAIMTLMFAALAPYM